MNKGDNIIDSRDVIKAFEDLNNEYETLCETLKESYEEWEGEKDKDAIKDIKDAVAALEEWSDYDDWKELKDLVEEAEGYGDWKYGETMILDSYFEDYARELADDIGAVKGEGWPNHCIDWKQAADELKMDYTSVSFGDYEYWIRS